jgi:myo-inositol catabolism protein IolC
MDMYLHTLTIHLHMYIYIYICVCMYVRTYVRMYVCMYVEIGHGTWPLHSISARSLLLRQPVELPECHPMWLDVRCGGWPTTLRSRVIAQIVTGSLMV